jgi:hypothetical protein
VLTSFGPQTYNLFAGFSRWQRLYKLWNYLRVTVKRRSLKNMSRELGSFLLWSHCLLLSLSFSFLPNYLITVLRISRCDVSGGSSRALALS